MTAPTQKLHFKVYGLDCAEEVAALKREVGPAVGGEGRLSFDILNGRMTVAAEGEGIAPEAVLRAVERTGMRAEVWREGPDGPHVRQRPLRPGGLFALAGFLTPSGTGRASRVGRSLGMARSTRELYLVRIDLALMILV